MSKDKALDELGFSNAPLCREPWESYYILRRGILPCCYGNPIVAPMNDWKKTWNSPEIQDIRRHLSLGELSPYCLASRGCPIVQRELARGTALPPSKFLPIVHRLNKILFGLPEKIYRSLRGNRRWFS